MRTFLSMLLSLLIAGCAAQQKCDYGLEMPGTKVCIQQQKLD
jgi:hypothetical protein